MNKRKPHIVILGSGFGGIYTFLNLRKKLSREQADITIINKTNYFLFTPLLHEVATGSLAHHQVVEAVRFLTHSSGAAFHMASVDRIETEHQTVQTSIGPITYDYLVMALGSSPHFYNIPGAMEHSSVLKNLGDAIRMRNRIIDVFERSVDVNDQKERRSMLTFAIVGGGATGVELAAELNDLVWSTFQKYYDGRRLCEEVTINLIAAEPELLTRFHPKMRVKALSILKKKGIKVSLGKSVTVVDDQGVTLNDGSRLEARHVMWTAGVKPNIPSADIQWKLNSQGRIIVDQTLRVSGKENIFALGDIASFDHTALPMHAQTAVQEAKVVAHNIVADISGGKQESFLYKSLGDLVSLGRWQAVGDFFGMQPSGPITWFIWRTVYLFKFASWSKRIKIMVDWTIDLFYPRDITKA